MQIRIADINCNVVSDIIEMCRTCLYWESPERFALRKHTDEEAGFKAEWFEKVEACFGPCGKVLYVDDKPAAYCQYAPPEYLPGISGYGSLAPQVDKDGVFVSCLYVSPDYHRKGLGRRLLRDVIDELKAHGVRSIETFSRNDSSDNCSGPTEFYLAHGFEVVATEIYPKGASLSLVRLIIS